MAPTSSTGPSFSGCSSTPRWARRPASSSVSSSRWDSRLCRTASSSDPFDNCRRGRRIGVCGSRSPASITVAAVVLAITAWRVPTTEPIDFAAAESTLGELIADEPAPATVDSIAKTASPEDLDNAVRLTGFGDSTALMTGLGITRWAEDHPDELTVVLGHAKLGCGLVTGGARRVEGRVGAVSDECDTWLADWVDAIRGKDVDIALVQLGAWEIFDHQVEPGGPFLAIGRDEEFDAMLRDRLGAAVTSLHEHSDVVAIVANPDVGQARPRQRAGGDELSRARP